MHGFEPCWHEVTGLAKHQGVEKSLRSSSTQTNQMPQQMEMPQVISLGQLTVPSMGTITINDDDTLAIARSYLDVLEKKIKEKKPGKSLIT